MKQTASGPFMITEEDIERSSTLDHTDLGAWYVLLNGTFQFVDDRQAGFRLVKLLQAIL